MSAAVHRLTVRGYHCDAYGHVNNARWLELFEEARWRLLEEADVLTRLHETGHGFVVVRIEVDYRRPALPQDVVEIRSWLAEAAGRSAVVRQQVFLVSREGESPRPFWSEKPLAEARVTFVVIDRRTGRSVPLPDDLRAILVSPAEGSPAEP